MYSFIILNYYNVDDTLECLKCLKRLDENNKCNYIVVDNNSLTKEEIEKIEKYTQDIIKLDDNYGFAIANNEGIKYAHKKYNSDYYAVINNDVFIHQKEFLNIIADDYKKYNFDMLGPKIDSPSGESINPFPAYIDKKTIEEEISKCNKLIKIYKNSLLFICLKLYLKIKYTFKKKNIPLNGEKIELNVPLHGCSIIFSKKYIEKYEFPFNNKTFLFHEEEFLYQRVIKDKLISLYDPNLNVFHKEGSSMKKSTKSERTKKLFKERERLKSLKILLEEIQ